MMKRLLTLLAVLAMAIGAKAIVYEDAAQQAYYLTDKMAHELNLTDEQYDRVYQINLDYFLKCRVEADVSGYLWEYRNACLARVLYTAQWRLFNTFDFFFRPLVWRANAWYFPYYDHYPRHRYYRPAPPPSYRRYRADYHRPYNGYRTGYRGGERGDHRGSTQPGVGRGSSQQGGVNVNINGDVNINGAGNNRGGRPAAADGRGQREVGRTSAADGTRRGQYGGGQSPRSTSTPSRDRSWQSSGSVARPSTGNYRGNSATRSMSAPSSARTAPAMGGNRAAGSRATFSGRSTRTSSGAYNGGSRSARR